MSFSLILQIIAIIIGLSVIALVSMKLYYRYVLHKKFYIIPRASTKGIANIGMILALSIATIVLLMVVTADMISIVFRLWAGTRVIIEGILIKIGGLLFGPIIGLCLGAAVDILAVSISAGVFNFGYLLTAMLFGLIGGFVRILINACKESNLKFSIYSTIISLLSMAIIVILFFWSDNRPIEFTTSIFSLEIGLSFNNMIIVLVASVIVPILILWGCYWVQWWQIKHKKKLTKWFKKFAPVFVTVILSEILCNILIMPWFDSMISPLDYNSWFLIRLILFVPMLTLNTIIVYPVYRVIVPVMSYRYEDDATDDLTKKKRISGINKKQDINIAKTSNHTPNKKVEVLK